MGHKVNPTSFRLIQDKNWSSKWFSKKDYRLNLLEDMVIRQTVEAQLGRISGISKIEIERDAQQVTINIYSSKPGIIIGRSGQGIEKLTETLNNKLEKAKNAWKWGVAKETDASDKKAKSKMKVNIIEVKSPDSIAALVAQNIAKQLEKRVSHRRAIKMSIERALQDRLVQGIKVAVGGRLNGAEIARSEKFSQGSIPLSAIRSDIDYSSTNAYTTYGTIGIKVWIYKGEKLISK